jgi:endonuclease III
MHIRSKQRRTRENTMTVDTRISRISKRLLELTP